MNNSISSLRPDDSGRPAGLARLVRQICLLREQGDVAGAGRLQQNDLATAVDEIRRTHGPEALPETELAALFAAETRRVNEAMLTAELLIHRLVEIWPSRAAPSSPVVREEAVASARPPERAAPAGPPVISDLLDAMLAAERTSTRLSPALNR